MKRLLSSLLLVFMIGCTPTIITKYKTIEVTKAPPPAPLHLSVPYFYVVSEENVEKFLMERQGEPFIAVSTHDYSVLAINTQEFIRYIKQCNANNKYYEKMLSAEQPK